MTHGRPPRDRRSERTTDRISWILAAVSAVLGVGHLAGLPLLVERFATWGYPDVFRHLIGVVLLLGAIGLLSHRTASIASTLLAMVMAGAVITHLFLGNPVVALLPATFLALLIHVGKRRLDTPSESQSPHEVPPGVL